MTNVEPKSRGYMTDLDRTDTSSVLLITVDCLRADHVGCYGYDRPTTPNIDTFSESATRFDHAYANSPGTRYALQTIHTGVWQRQVDGLGIPEESGTPLAEFLNHAGYNIGFFVNNGYGSRDYNYNRGVDNFQGVQEFRKERPTDKRLLLNIREKLPDGQIKTTLRNAYRSLVPSPWESNTGDSRFRPDVEDDVPVTRARDWIHSNQASGTKHFTWVHLMNVHTPFGRYDHHLQAIRGDTDVDHVIKPEKEGVGGSHIESADEIPQRLLDTYDAAVRSADEQIGRLLDAVDDDTVVIITADHGEEMGEFRYYHAMSMYGTMAQIPMLIRGPQFESGAVESSPVQHLDIPPTIAASVGTDIPDSWEGSPLQTVDRELDESIFFGLDASRVGVRMGDWKLIMEVDSDRRELYNVPHMEIESKDISDEYPDKVEELETLVRTHLSYVEANMLGKSDSEELSAVVEQNLEELGYLDSR